MTDARVAFERLLTAAERLRRAGTTMDDGKDDKAGKAAGKRRGGARSSLEPSPEERLCVYVAELQTRLSQVGTPHICQPRGI